MHGEQPRAGSSAPAVGHEQGDGVVSAEQVTETGSQGSVLVGTFDNGGSKLLHLRPSAAAPTASPQTASCSPTGQRHSPAAAHGHVEGALGAELAGHWVENGGLICTHSLEGWEAAVSTIQDGSWQYRCPTA